jgi:uncharacterized protein (TIGR00369 family)
MLARAWKSVVGKVMGFVSPHMRWLGLEFVSMERGRCVVKIPYNADCVGDPATGVLHGGVVTSLLDSAGGGAVVSAIGMPTPIATLDLRIDYLRPSTPGEPLIADVECFKLTHHVAFTRGTAYNRDASDPVAAMTATYMLRTTALPRDPSEGTSA